MAEQKVMERDPVCGMQVDPASARAKAEYGGKSYFFCCAGCAKKFEAAPEQYLKPRPAASGPMLTMIAPAGAPGAPVRNPVPMHPSAAPAAGASAGAPASPKASAVDYICPMHPEVHENKPEACPKCGMALEPAVPAGPSKKPEYVCRWVSV